MSLLDIKYVFIWQSKVIIFHMTWWCSPAKCPEKDTWMLRMKLSKLVPSIDDIRYHVRIIASFLSLVTRMLLRQETSTHLASPRALWHGHHLDHQQHVEALEKAVQMTWRMDVHGPYMASIWAPRTIRDASCLTPGSQTSHMKHVSTRKCLQRILTIRWITGLEANDAGFELMWFLTWLLTWFLTWILAIKLRLKLGLKRVFRWRWCHMNRQGLALRCSGNYSQAVFFSLCLLCPSSSSGRRSGHHLRSHGRLMITKRFRRNSLRRCFHLRLRRWRWCFHLRCLSWNHCHLRRLIHLRSWSTWHSSKHLSDILWTTSCFLIQLLLALLLGLLLHPSGVPPKLLCELYHMIILWTHRKGILDLPLVLFWPSKWTNDSVVRSLALPLQLVIVQAASDTRGLKTDGHHKISYVKQQTYILQIFLKE